VGQHLPTHLPRLVAIAAPHCREDIRICARYDRAMPDAYSSDIRVGSLTAGEEWTAKETAYGINLNPERLAESLPLSRGVWERSGSALVVAFRHP
jgi:hypothetical protein